MIKVDISYKDIFDNVSLTIPDRGITVIIGDNGSGKSTFAYLLMGLLKPSRGKIEIDKDLVKKGKKNSNISLSFQNPDLNILLLSVYDDMEFTLNNAKFPSENIPEIIEKSLTKLEMIKYAKSNPQKLSLGQRAKISIAEMLALDTKYMIFDEPTAFLNGKTKNLVFDLFEKLKKKHSIIFITNDLSEIIYAEKIIIIDQKQIFTYSSKEIISTPDILTSHNLEIPLNLQILHILKEKNITFKRDKDIIAWLQKNI